MLFLFKLAMTFFAALMICYALADMIKSTSKKGIESRWYTVVMIIMIVSIFGIIGTIMAAIWTL